MTARRVVSLRRVLDLCRVQEHGAEIAVNRSAQGVASMMKRIALLESRQASEPPLSQGEGELIDTERLLSSGALALMHQRTLLRLKAARLEHLQCEKELAGRRRVVDQVRGVLSRLQAERDRTVQRREQQEMDDLYAAQHQARSREKKQS